MGLVSVRLITKQPPHNLTVELTLLLPACEFDSQDEQDAEHDSPAEETRSPGHQKQHLPERLPHPAQHYRLSSSLRPIYTPRLLPSESICLNRRVWGRGAGTDAGSVGDGANLDWTSVLLVCQVHKRGQTNLSSPRRLSTSATTT